MCTSSIGIWRLTISDELPKDESERASACQTAFIVLHVKTT